MMGEQKSLGPEEMRSHTLAQPQGSRQVTCRAQGPTRGLGGWPQRPAEGLLTVRLMPNKHGCLLIKRLTCCSY